jgi:hypothetical protein
MRAPSPPRLPPAKFFATVASRKAHYKLMEEKTLRLYNCHRRHPPDTRGAEREISMSHPTGIYYQVAWSEKSPNLLAIAHTSAILSVAIVSTLEGFTASYPAWRMSPWISFA